MSRPLHHTAVALTLVLVAGCGGDRATPSDPIDVTLTPTVGEVAPPAGVTVATVLNAFADAPVTDGAFALPSPAGHRQLTVALSASGEPLLMGWLGAGHETLTPRTTADVLTFLALGGFALPPEAQLLLMDLVAAAPEVAPLADALAQALAARPDGLGDALDADLQAALHGAVAALLDAPAVGLPNALLVNPSAEGSGIKLNTVSGLNQITLTNRFRRRAFAFFDRVSVFHDGQESASPAQVARVEIAPVTGLADGVGTLNQLVIGAASPEELSQNEDVAYVPRDSEPVSLPNVTGASRTRYRVAVVGPGDGDGALATLSDAERAEQRHTSMRFVVKDYVIPFIVHIIAPAGLALNSGPGEAASDAIVNLLSGHTEVVDNAVSGKISAVLGLVLGVNAFRAKIPEKLLIQIATIIVDKLFAGSTTAVLKASEVVTAVKKYVQVFALINVTLTFADARIVEGDMALSNKADVWTVDVGDAKVRLDPAESTVDVTEIVTFTARVLDAGDDVVFEYRYSTAGEHGSLYTALDKGTEITSSVEFVTYAPESIGDEEVKVAVYEVRNADRVYVGEATAVVHIAGDGVLLTPKDAEVDPFGEVALTAKAIGDDVPETLIFRWSTASGLGTLDGGETAERESDEGSATVTFTGGIQRGDETVTVEVFVPGSEDEPWATASVDVAVKGFRVRITPGESAIDAGESVTLTATAAPDPPSGTFSFQWSVAGYAGTVDGAEQVEHEVTEGVTDDVTYQAEAEPEGDPTLCRRLVKVSLRWQGDAGTAWAPETGATVKVACPPEAALRTARAVVERGGSTTVTLELANVVDPDAYTVGWAVSGADGGLSVGGTAVGAAPIAARQVTFTAGEASGDATVTATVFDGADAIAEAAVTIHIDFEGVIWYASGVYDLVDLRPDYPETPRWGADAFCPRVAGITTTGMFITWSGAEAEFWFGPSGQTYRTPRWDDVRTDGARVFMDRTETSTYTVGGAEAQSYIARFKAAVAGRSYDCVGYRDP